MLLSNDLEMFSAIVKEVFEKTGVQSNYIEKDYYAISVLKELISRNNKFVFKGGTSLSVCQKAINRFSEDIDISYEDEHITVGQRKQIKQAFFDSIQAVSLTVSNSDNIRSRRVFNRYMCPYVSKFTGANDQVLVEWATKPHLFLLKKKLLKPLLANI